MDMARADSFRAGAPRGYPPGALPHGVLHLMPATALARPAFRAAWEGTLLPALRAFAPGLVVISAGFDGHARDPLAQLRLTEADFAWVTEAPCAAANACCGGRVVSLLEGGYDLHALAASAAAHVRALLHA